MYLQCLSIALLSSVVWSATYQFYFLGTCNVTCGECKGQQYPNTCVSCQQDLVLDPDTGSCVSRAGDTVYYLENFMDKKLSSQPQTYTGWSLYSIGQTQNLTSADTQGCININSANYFYFQVLGLYKSGYTLITTLTFPTQIQSLQTYFRVLYFTSPMTISVSFNQQTVLKTNVSSSNFTSYLGNVTVDSASSTTALDCSTFTYNTATLYYKKFRSEKQPQQTNSVLVRFQADYTQNSNSVQWGIREIVFIAIKCTSCPSAFITKAATTLGIIIGVVTGALVILVLPILVLEKLKISQILDRKRNIKLKLTTKRVARNKELLVPRLIMRILRTNVTRSP